MSPPSRSKGLRIKTPPPSTSFMEDDLRLRETSPLRPPLSPISAGKFLSFFSYNILVIYLSHFSYPFILITGVDFNLHEHSPPVQRGSPIHLAELSPTIIVSSEHSSEPIEAFMKSLEKGLMVYRYHGTHFEQSSIPQLIEEPLEEINNEPLETYENIDIQGISFTFFLYFFLLLPPFYTGFILNAGLREYLDKLTLTASHTCLNYSFPNEHLPEFLFTYYPLSTIKGFVDTLVRPCIEKLHLISIEYISGEYDRRWDVSSNIARAMTVLENSISTLRLRIMRTQDRVTHELRSYAILHVRRANYEMLNQKKIEVAALKAEVNQLATQLGNLQETLDSYVKEYIAAQRNIDSINTEMSANAQEAERLLDRLSTFISRMPGYP